jgi:hypothetical protein
LCYELFKQRIKKLIKNNTWKGSSSQLHSASMKQSSGGKKTEQQPAGVETEQQATKQESFDFQERREDRKRERRDIASGTWAP